MGSNASLSVVLKGWREGARLAKSIYQPFVGMVGRFPPVSPRYSRIASGFAFFFLWCEDRSYACTQIQFPVAVHPEEFIAFHANLVKGRQTFAQNIGVRF